MMIERIIGTIIEKTSTSVVVETGGVGYILHTSVKTSDTLPPSGTKATILTEMIVREDSISLYGFISNNERELFKLLISISGIGAKIALGILSAVTISEFNQLILKKDIVSLKKLPGIGIKTAERLHLELKDKIKGVALVEEDEDHVHTDDNIKQEAIAALISLGYNKQAAEKSVDKVFKENGREIHSIEDLIKKSLKNTMK